MNKSPVSFWGSGLQKDHLRVTHGKSWVRETESKGKQVRGHSGQLQLGEAGADWRKMMVLERAKGQTCLQMGARLRDITRSHK